MRFHWRLGSVPELASLSKERRKQLWAAHGKTAFRKPVVWGLYSGSMLVSGGLWLASVWLYPPLNQSPYEYPWLCLVFAPAFVCHIPFQIHAMLPDVRRELGLCPACGYDLRATPDRCPECGAAAHKS